MKPVIRRILLLTFSVLVLAGCSAQERDALRVGEESISEQGLTDLVLALSGGAPDGEEPSERLERYGFAMPLRSRTSRKTV
jgi:hypothetical protein